MKRILYSFVLVVALFSLSVISFCFGDLISIVLATSATIIGFMVLNTIFVENEQKGGELCELYKKLLVAFESSPNFLCHRIDSLDISDKQREKLHNHFQSQKPTPSKHLRFFIGKNFINGHAWWFYSEGKNDRKDFIKLMISLTSREGI
jgi:hypothetical protein